MSKRPKHLPECDPHARFFPLEWKESYFRRHYDDSAGGYVCPGCGDVFTGTKGLRSLHADHRHPVAAGGRTEWDNMVLLCGPCNRLKRDRTGVIFETQE